MDNVALVAEETRRTGRKKPFPMLLHSPRIPHGLDCDRTRVFSVRRLFSIELDRNTVTEHLVDSRWTQFKASIEQLLRWAGHVARVGEERGMCRVLVGKPEGKRPVGRPRRRWADNIRMDLQEVGCGNLDWIGLAQDRDRWRTLVSAVMNLRVP